MMLPQILSNVIVNISELDITTKNNYFYEGAEIEKVKFFHLVFRAIFPEKYLNTSSYNLLAIFSYSSLQLEKFLTAQATFRFVILSYGVGQCVETAKMQTLDSRCRNLLRTL